MQASKGSWETEPGRTAVASERVAEGELVRGCQGCHSRHAQESLLGPSQPVAGTSLGDGCCGWSQHGLAARVSVVVVWLVQAARLQSWLCPETREARLLPSTFASSSKREGRSTCPTYLLLKSGP